ncbi:MAG: hypothetical protein ACI9U2_002169 [Bradymonadia bacterium]
MIASRAFAGIGWVLLRLAALFSVAHAHPLRIDGMALSPHFELPDAGMTFESMVDEIASLGASHMSLVVQWSQTDVTASALGPDAKETLPDARLRGMIRRARAHGVDVMLFPILWVEHRKVGEWRGTLAPIDPDAWWASYATFVLHYAHIAQDEGAAIYSIGSELASLEVEEPRWRALIAQVRAVFKGQLIYSANWDHYAEVPFWDALDLVGLTAYYELTADPDASVAELTTAWRKIRDVLLDWRALTRTKAPLVFTELGYPSIDGTATAPWDYTRTTAVDLEEQRRCLEAFRRAWGHREELAGVFFWNWFGPGGPQDRWYSLKGKPALEVVKRWYARPRAGALDGPPTRLPPLP